MNLFDTLFMIGSIGLIITLPIILILDTSRTRLIYEKIGNQVMLLKIFRMFKMILFITMMTSIGCITICGFHFEYILHMHY
jgi:hypothetical protein